MSTTIKRIALVAVAALGLGVMSVAPSQATNTVLKFQAGDAAGTNNTTGFGVAGPFNYVTVKVDTAAADYVLTTSTTFLSVGDAAAGTSTLSPDAKSISSTDTIVEGIRVATPAVGTVTVQYWVRTGGVLAATAAQTVTITVNATAQSGAYSAANSTAFIVAGETNTALTATADATVTGLGTANVETATATIAVTLKDALKNALNDTVTATVISGGANVRVASAADSATAVAAAAAVTPGTFSASVMTTSGQALVFVHPNGNAGPAVIRLTNSAGTEIAQKTVTFSSTTVATIAATVVFGNVTSAGKAGSVTVIAKDAAGYVVPNAVITAVSGTLTSIASPSNATTDSTGKASFTVAAASATATGSSIITFKTGTATTTATVRAAGVQATKLTISASASSAEAGSKVTYTLEASDANGVLADGDYVGKFFTGAPVTSNSGTGAFATDTITVLNGKATSEVFVPFISGNYSTTWTLKGTAGGAATADLAAALVGTKITVDVAVTNASADAALDAANEAATAAQDATDAAIQAADAADEATAAVAALSLEVNTLIAGLKKQLVTLTNLVKNLQKAVNAKK